MTSGRPPSSGSPARACFPVDDEAPTGGAGRLDRALDDDVEEHEGVVRRGEGLAERVDRILDAAALGGELAGHLVERASEGRKLVAPPHRHTLAELASRHGAGGIGELPQRAHDRPAEEPGEDRDDREGEEGEDQEPLPQSGDRVVDRGFRRDDDERERRVDARMRADTAR